MLTQWTPYCGKSVMDKNESTRIMSFVVRRQNIVLIDVLSQLKAVYTHYIQC